MLAIRIFVVLSLLVAVRGQEPAPAPALAEPVRDGLGRSTPRGTVFGFLAAAHRGEYSAAAQFLDTPLKGTAADELASQLIVVLDRRMPAHLDQLSNQPNGSMNDNLPLGKELVGVIPASSGSLEVSLERARRGDATIWLFSPETLERIPEVYGELKFSSTGEYVPEWLSKRGWFSIPLWQWLALAGGLALAVGVSSLLRRIVLPVLRRLFGRLVGKQDDHLLDQLIGPIRGLVLLGVLHANIVLLHLPLIAREAWRATSTTLLIIASTWLFRRIVKVFGRVSGRRLAQMGKRDSTSVVRLMQRILNFAAGFVAIVIVARRAGFNVTTVLAGLGVGGIAVALAAQKTLENLFGGVSIIFDKPIRLGDLCRIGDQEGRVEDIGIRSTRFRTLDRTVLTIPNGQLSVMNLENLGMRDKMRFRHIVGLRCETTGGQLNSVLDGLRALLAGHDLVETVTARARLVKLGPSSLDLEVFAHVLTIETEKFLEIQEELLVGILEVVERSGTATAVPTQVVYLSQGLAGGTDRSPNTLQHLMPRATRAINSNNESYGRAPTALNP
jgi:MscS family membrane protein